MRKDTQIGVILGVVILGIIAVFLSTRTNVSKTTSSDTNVTQNEGEDQVRLPDDIFKDDTFIEETLESDIGDIIASGSRKKEKTEEIEINEDDFYAKKDVETAKERPMFQEVNETAAKQEPENAVKERKTEVAANVSNAAPSVASNFNADTRVLTHKVGGKDSLYSLAKRYYGDSAKWSKILNANTEVIYDRNSLPRGEELIIPDVRVLDERDPNKPAPVTSFPTKKAPAVAAVSEKSATSGGNEKRHIVKEGDSLFKIAKKYYGSVKDWELIADANQDVIGDNNTVYVGRELIIPGIKGNAAGKKAGRKTYTLSSETKVKKAGKTYTIKEGDTLYKIAQDHYKNGAKWEIIYEANKDVLNGSHMIRAGVDIVIP